LMHSVTERPLPPRGGETERGSVTILGPWRPVADPLPALPLAGRGIAYEKIDVFPNV
jgi:hypothetical protein